MSKAYSEAKKYEVVTTYLALGKAPMVEAVTGVPATTIRSWKMQPWWKELEHEIKSDDNAQLSGKLKKIIDRSLDAVVDRLDHGDFILDSRSGKVRRVPVKLRDVHRVSTDLIDKRTLLNKETALVQDKTTVEDVIKKLAQHFADFASRSNKRERVIDAEVVEIEENENSVHDRRETRLQAGECLVQLPPLSGEEEGGAEQSPSNDGEEARLQHP